LAFPYQTRKCRGRPALLQEAVQFAPDDTDLRGALADALDDWAVILRRPVLRAALERRRRINLGILNNLAWLEATTRRSATRRDAVRLQPGACELTRYARPVTCVPFSSDRRGGRPAGRHRHRSARGAVPLTLGLSREVPIFVLLRATSVTASASNFKLKP